jgi:hypothetical protein
VPVGYLDWSQFLQSNGPEMRVDLTRDELAVTLAGLWAEPGICIEPITEVAFEGNLIRDHVLAIIGALDEPPQFLPSFADRAAKGLGEAFAIDAPAQPPATGTACVDAAVAMIALRHVPIPSHEERAAANDPSRPVASRSHGPAFC